MSSAVKELTVGILVVSDTAAADHATDRAIDTLTAVIAEANAAITVQGASYEWLVEERRIVPDDKLRIQDKLRDWCDSKRLSLVVTTGGTGFGPRDVTPEAVSELLEKPATGLVHGMLAASLKITPFAVMSRPVAGVRKETVIITLPGSPKGAKENLEAIIKLLPHACVQAAGSDSRSLHSGGTIKLEQEAGLTGDAVASARRSPGQHDHHSHLHESGGIASDNAGSVGHSHCGHHAPKPRSNELSGDVTRRHRSSPYPMISVAEAHKLVAANLPILGTTKRKVDSSLVGYILAEDIVAVESVPAFRASIVDGYAVVHTDGAGVYPVTAVAHATSTSDAAPLAAGQIARITTGAPLPPGATAVVMVEDTRIVEKTEDEKEELRVEILASGLEDMENVREVGSDVRAGQLVLQKGAQITGVGGEIGLLASVGVQEVAVYHRPVVGVLSTGDEVVDHDRPGELKLGEVRDSNRPALIAAIRSRGYEAVDLGIARDKAETLEEVLKGALPKVDLLITTGGVSMGEKDLLKPTIERTFTGTIHFGRVAMKPGKPTTFATIPAVDDGVGKPIFSLPGNPASATVTFHLFVLPALRQLSGHIGSERYLPTALVTLDHDVPLDARPEFHRAVVTIDKGTLQARSTGGQRSSRIGSMEAANALLCLPGLTEVGDKRKRIPRGDKVAALLIGELTMSGV